MAEVGDHGLELWADRVARMSLRIKGPRHPPRMQLRCTKDKVEEDIAGAEGRLWYSHSSSGDGPTVTSRVGKPRFTPRRALKGASFP